MSKEKEVVDAVKVAHPKAGKWDAKTVRESAKQILGLENGTPKDLVDKLVIKFAGSDKEFLTCDECEGQSPDDLDACPYCGAGDEDDLAVAKKANEKAIERKGKADVVPSPAELDKHLKKIEKFKEGIYKNWWALGNEYRMVRDDRSWAARLDENGQAVYRSFEAWCQKEAGHARKFVTQLIDMSVHFTPEQVDKYGKGPLAVLVAAPEEDRVNLLKDLEAKELTISELTQRVKEAREARNVKRRKTTNPNSKKEMPVGGRKPENVTVVFPVGMVEVPLFEVQKAPKGKHPPEQIPATSADGKPWGVFDTAVNGVKVFLSLKHNKAGNLVAILHASREEDLG